MVPKGPWTWEPGARPSQGPRPQKVLISVRTQRPMACMPLAPLLELQPLGLNTVPCRGPWSWGVAAWGDLVHSVLPPAGGAAKL